MSLKRHADWIPNRALPTPPVPASTQMKTLYEPTSPTLTSLKQSAVSRSFHLRFRILVNFRSYYLSAIDLYEVFRFSSAAPAVNPLLSK